ncbi:hypothetical protein Tco_1168375 [Tanacetum coccineum]
MQPTDLYRCISNLGRTPASKVGSTGAASGMSKSPESSSDMLIKAEDERSKVVKGGDNRKNEMRQAIYRENRRNMERRALTGVDMEQSQPCNESSWTGGIISRNKVGLAEASRIHWRATAILPSGSLHQQIGAIRHISALKELLKEPNNRNLIKPMLLDFEDSHDVSDDEVQDNGKGKTKIDEEDLSKPVSLKILSRTMEVRS